MADKDPTAVVEGILSSGRNIRLGKGVVSKTSYVAAIIALVWAFIVWRLSDNMTLNAVLIAVGLILTFFGIWFIRGTQRFAEKNPAQALLEGAELLEWQKAEIQAKGLPPVPSAPALPGHGSPLIDVTKSGGGA